MSIVSRSGWGYFLHDVQVSEPINSLLHSFLQNTERRFTYCSFAMDANVVTRAIHGVRPVLFSITVRLAWYAWVNKALIERKLSMPETTVFLVRHGQTPSNNQGLLNGRNDTPLTPLGHAQAERAAERLAELRPLHALYSSPLRRARETAEPIAQRLNLPVQLHEGLTEFNFGLAEGLTLEEVRERFPAIFARVMSGANDLDLRFPEGESAREFYERVDRTMREILAAHRGQRIVIVSHGGVIGAAIALLIGDDPVRWSRNPLPNASITELVVPEHGPARLLIAGDTHHLDTLEVQI